MVGFWCLSLLCSLYIFSILTSESSIRKAWEAFSSMVNGCFFYTRTAVQHSVFSIVSSELISRKAWGSRWLGPKKQMKPFRLKILRFAERKWMVGWCVFLIYLGLQYVKKKFKNTLKVYNIFYWIFSNQFWMVKMY